MRRLDFELIKQFGEKLEQAAELEDVPTLARLTEEFADYVLYFGNIFVP